MTSRGPGHCTARAQVTSQLLQLRQTVSGRGSGLARVTQSRHGRVVCGVHGGCGGVHVLQCVGIVAPVTSLARKLVCHAVTSVQVLELLSLLHLSSVVLLLLLQLLLLL